MVKCSEPPKKASDSIKPQFYNLVAGKELRRIYKPKPDRNGKTFRYYGPLHRFDHHQPLTRLEIDQGLKGKDDPNRGVNYWGFTLECCIVEVFGDHRIITSDDLANNNLAKIIIQDPIKLLDIRSKYTMQIGANATISKNESRRMTQAWGRYFYEQNVFNNVEGVIYENAHNGEETIMFNERGNLKILNSTLKVMPLKSKNLKIAIRDCADRNLITFD